MSAEELVKPANLLDKDPSKLSSMMTAVTLLVQISKYCILRMVLILIIWDYWID